jgi:hypothetical protein
MGGSRHRPKGSNPEATWGRIASARPADTTFSKAVCSPRLAAMMLVAKGVLTRMNNGSSDLSSLDDLRGFVQRTICDQRQLLLGAFQFREQILVREGEPCGLRFILSGPRAVQFAAFWDATRHAILFYDCNGDRFHRSDLTGSAEISEELASLARPNGKLAT